MFTQLVKNPLTLERYRNGPFAQEREQYLTHLSQRGYGKGRIDGNQHSTPCHRPAATNQRPQTRNEGRGL